MGNQISKDHHIEQKDKSEIEVVVLPKQTRNLEACIEAYDWTSLIKYVDTETCLGLKKQIQSNKATVRQRLVRVVMAIVERGADRPDSEGKNQFYYPILKSDLDDELKEIVSYIRQQSWI
ncbi:MAG: hypothetical protein EZS28_026961 [Streblomastix strix]|uniref:Uncharacterized protein n=1 Tax=Streblomastix strix TaxID=222440 RepID=A0A5J4V5W2_9EUKA|nr:MAG: hypothetical protein EZS28_026961 [Streblomastix strix]